MVTARQKEAARRNLQKGRRVRSARAQGLRIPRTSGLSTARQNRMSPRDFALPKERKEPLVGARHVCNAVSRFDQVEGVTDRERDAAWRQIRSVADSFGVEIEAKNWREPFAGAKAKKRCMSGDRLTRRERPARTDTRMSQKAVRP